MLQVYSLAVTVEETGRSSLKTLAPLRTEGKISGEKTLRINDRVELLLFRVTLRFRCMLRLAWSRARKSRLVVASFSLPALLFQSIEPKENQ